MRQSLTLIESAGPEVYPLPTDLRLTGHYFTMLMHDRWLYSRLRLTASVAVRGAALDLFLLAQKQAPLGTLPCDDAELASLLHLPTGEWLKLKGETPNPLYGWRHCVTDRGETRLMHPVVLEVAEETIGKRKAGAAKREADQQYVRLKRIREKLLDAGGTERMRSDGMLIERIDEWLAKNCAGSRTVLRIKEALEALSAGEF